MKLYKTSKPKLMRVKLYHLGYKTKAIMKFTYHIVFTNITPTRNQSWLDLDSGNLVMAFELDLELLWLGLQP